MPELVQCGHENVDRNQNEIENALTSEADNALMSEDYFGAILAKLRGSVSKDVELEF
jgi:hypothetical protein